ncbi:MAG: GatB/YqeY domain-containing protein, partial [Thermoleophilia bacterium]|nr:GatB/YqeY domain-containing protein [Thermoleophilia bacterium]
MTVAATIEQHLKEARLARAATRRDALALVLNALRVAEKDLQRPLSDQESLQVLQRERKRRVEAIEAFRGAGREAQAAAEEFELGVIEEFMPEQLSEEELEEIVDDVIAEVGATSLRDLGRVMAAAVPRV